MSYSHPAEDRSALKGTGNLKQTKTWAKYQHTMLSERRQSQKDKQLHRVHLEELNSQTCATEWWLLRGGAEKCLQHLMGKGDEKRS